MRLIRVFFLLISTTAADASLAGQPGPWVERSRYLMGTICTARAEGDPVATGAALDAALDRIAALEDAMTTYRPDGGLARLNRALADDPPGTAHPVGPELFAALDSALRWARSTDGLFEPAIGGLIEVWDLRGSGRWPGDAEILAALAGVSWRGVRLDPASRSVAARRPGLALDLGGFGKGYALDAAAEVLAREGVTRALINFGGQVLAMGAPSGEPGWVVEIAHPAHRDRAVASIRVRDASVATSGNAEHFFVTEQGRRIGHLLDPRTGRPVERAGSMTVVAPTATAADVLATAAFVEGPSGAAGLLRGGAEYLYLEPSSQGAALTGESTPTMRARLSEIEPIRWKESK